MCTFATIATGSFIQKRFPRGDSNLPVLILESERSFSWDFRSAEKEGTFEAPASFIAHRMTFMRESDMRNRGRLSMVSSMKVYMATASI